ncbi:hypothetical protein KR093_008639 [Drosophila rubida]|uniref:Gamma tubulin complex component protein N-terminal domain-containing protein n=1 Tax=Drosophila rubida TaxID=30044 RepID=A0AAD4PJC9_9MUSC|nr:hypothetical protein KR093_008639 [Drosophila rubida]
MQQQQEELVAQRLPELMHRLLDCDEENKHPDYDDCLQYAKQRMANFNRPPDSPESVEENLGNFIERFHLEFLEELGDTVKLLSQVILDDLQLPEPLKWAVLNFMLSVNFRAFNSARMFLRDRKACRSQLLESLDWAYRIKKEARLSAEQQQLEVLQKQPLELDSEVGSIAGSSVSAGTNLSSVDLSLDLSLLSSPEGGSSQVSPASIRQPWPYFRQQQQPEQTPELQQQEQHARQSLSLALSQLQLSQELQQSEHSIESLPPNEPRIVTNFGATFGAHLRQPLQDDQLAMELYGEEGYLLRELLSMFFQPRDCRNFELVNQLIQLRPEAMSSNPIKQQMLAQFIQPLQYMQLLQLFIDCYQRHLETLSCLTAALRRLLKPVVETLTYFEQRVAIDSKQATLRSLLRAMRPNLPRLQLLWSLAAASYVLPPQQLDIAAHFRSQHIVHNLLQLAALPPHVDTDGRRGAAAALLLHVLQVYCQCLDSWWLLGDFQDWHDEFPAQLQLVGGRTHYVMRTLHGEEVALLQCPIYQIIERHIICAGKSLAVLHDAKRLGHFVGVHRALLKKSLHHMLVKTLLPQLKPYQLEQPRKLPRAPDIFRQLKATENEQLRAMYYAYYKETLVDFKLPTVCTIDELLRQCHGCVSYAPLHELICRSLDRVLEPRVLLVNAFVVHLLRETLQLAPVLAELRAVYLLFDFAQYAEQLELAVDQLEHGCHVLAAEQLQLVLERHNSRVAYPFRVVLNSADLDQLSLLYSCDAALDCIIYASQLDLYNIAFRRQLQLQVALRKLQQLPAFGFNTKVSGSLVSFKSSLELALERQLKQASLLRASAECEAQLQLSGSLPQLQLAHNTFVQQMCRILLTDNDNEELLQELLMLANIMGKHWLRLKRVFGHPSTPSVGCEVAADFDVRFGKLKIDYLLSIHRMTDAMQCLLG